MMNRKGQAALELAILGILILTAFSFIMSFGQSLGAYQQNKMETFRKALQKSYIRNAGVTYSYKKNIRSASTNSGFFQGQALAPESSTNVTWQKGKPGDFKSKNQSSFAFLQIDDQNITGQNDTVGLTGDLREYGLPLNLQTTYSATGEENDDQVLIPGSVYKHNLARSEAYQYQLNKNESPGGITYTKSASLTDSTAGTVYTHFNTAVDKTPTDDNPKPPEYEESLAIPYSTSTDYGYDSTWTVPHDASGGVPTGDTSAGRRQKIYSEQAWDDQYWSGKTSTEQADAILIRANVYSCTRAGNTWVVTDFSSGGGYCNTA